MLIVLALFGGLIYLSTKDKIDVSNVDAYKVLAGSEQSGNIADHAYGSKANKLVLIEYGDYQCPGCGSAYEPIKEITEKYKGKLTFVFRNYPLTSIHPNAKASAAAAEAAVVAVFGELDRTAVGSFLGLRVGQQLFQHKASIGIAQTVILEAAVGAAPRLSRQPD